MILMAAVFITSCSPAGAAQFDPENDIHCAVLSVAFRLIAADQDIPIPAEQRKTIAFVDKWYNKKLLEITESRGSEKVLAEAEPIAILIEKNLPSFKDEAATCISRAVSEAGVSS
jgi:hypothetical protein